MELETRRKSGRRSLNGGQYRAVTFSAWSERPRTSAASGVLVKLHSPRLLLSGIKAVTLTEHDQIGGFSDVG